jgi:hypothetical protein
MHWRRLTAGMPSWKQKSCLPAPFNSSRASAPRNARALLLAALDALGQANR